MTLTYSASLSDLTVSAPQQDTRSPWRPSVWLFISVVWVLGWTWAWSHYDANWMMLVAFVPVGIAFLLSRTLWVWSDKPSEGKTDE